MIQSLRIAAFSLLYLALPGFLEAQPAAAPFHHPVPAASAYVVTRDVAYTKADGQDVLLDVYRPAGASREARPVLVFVNTRHGTAQRTHGIYTGWAAAATARGFVAILPDAAPDFAAGFDALLAHVQANAAALGVDPGRVAVYAASGNAFTAFPVLQDPKRTGVHAAVLYYGGAPTPAFRPDLPVLVVRAGLDRPQLNRDVDALIAAGLAANAPLEVLNFAGGRHAFEMLDDNDVTRTAIDRTLEFVATALAPGYQAGLRSGIEAARAAGAMSSGDHATAIAIYGKRVREQPTDWAQRLAYAEALLAGGRIKEARREFEGLEGKGLGARDLAVPAARAAVADGDATAAIAWLARIPKRFLPAALATDAQFAPLRGTPEFDALFR
jgi:dienelactone hydrolase